MRFLRLVRVAAPAHQTPFFFAPSHAAKTQIPPVCANEAPVELDGRRTVYTAEEWHKLCAELRGMRVCQQFSVIGDGLFKREKVEDEEVDLQEEG